MEWPQWVGFLFRMEQDRERVILTQIGSRDAVCRRDTSLGYVGQSQFVSVSVSMIGATVPLSSPP
jgi:hypothetical protein